MIIQQIFKKHANYTKLPDMDFDYMMDEEDFTNAAKELIEYHVKAALLQASEQITCCSYEQYSHAPRYQVTTKVIGCIAYRCGYAQVFIN